MPQENGPLNQYYTSTIKTDFGWMRPVSDGCSLVRLDWNQSGWPDTDHPDNVSRETKAQLKAFFAGQLKAFSLPLNPSGKTAGGRYWLTVLAKIPNGTGISNADSAKLAGKPKAPRTAGTTCASNPIPIIYPCHRVIRTNGTLGYYSGGCKTNPPPKENMVRKSLLLHFERSRVDNVN